MSNIFKALADGNRRKILNLLAKRDMTAGEIAEHFTVTRATLSGHFNILKTADLIQERKDKNHIIYNLNTSVLEEAMLNFMNQFKFNSGDKTNEQ